MKIQLSDRELVGVWNYMCQASYGGEELLAQAETWEALGFEERFKGLAGRDKMDLKDLSGELVDFELSDGAVDYLKSVLKRNPQPLGTALQAAKALRRLG